MPDICAQQAPACWTLPHIAQPSLSLFALLLSLSLWPPVTRAEIRVVTAQGEHRMGDRDTREDAIRLATEAAKQQALEEVAVYLESVTVVNNMDVTKDEIRTYTAGLVLVLEQNTDLRIDGDAIVVKTYLVAQIDTDEVSHAIKALRENEDAKHQLLALRQENDQLQENLDAANQALAKASTAEQTQQAAQQRQDILNQTQSNAMVSQAWTDWALGAPTVSRNRTGPDPGAPEPGPESLSREPTCPSGSASHHREAAAGSATTTCSPAPGMRRSTMPSYQLVPHQAGSQRGLLRLNEITYKAAPAHQQSMQRQSQAGQPPITKRPPPAGNQAYPPALRQIPRTPHQLAPRTRDNGGQNSGRGSGPRNDRRRER